MKITCQSCQSKYNVADEKVQGKIVKIRCRKCGGTIVVNATAGAPAPSANGARDDAAQSVVPTPAAGGEWHVNLGDNDQRQMTLAELVEAYNTGGITQDTYIWTDGMDDWRPLAEVEPVVTALHASAAQAQAAPAPAAYEQPAARAAYEQPAAQAYEPPARAAYEAPAAAAYKPAVAAAPAYEVAAAPAAASYGVQAPVQEAKRAAVKREARGRDLFSTQMGEDVQTSAAASNMLSPPVDDGRLTGQRNENSVLFSLAVLTKNAEERASPDAEAQSKDDSGMIDLKALVAKSESARPAPRHDADVFAPPLGFAAPAVAAPLGPLGVPGTEAQGKSKLPLLIGATGGIAVLLALGIFIGVKLASGGAAVAPTASAAASTLPVPSASATTEASASAAPEASAAPSASVAAKPKTGGTGGGAAYHPPSGGAKPPAAGANASPASPALPPSPTPKKGGGGDCGCNGDLMCLMKCSTHN
jgi:predicted Zn finger-like uncharacterized protein